MDVAAATAMEATGLAARCWTQRPGSRPSDRARAVGRRGVRRHAPKQLALNLLDVVEEVRVTRHRRFLRRTDEPVRLAEPVKLDQAAVMSRYEAPKAAKHD